jgi:hypothetical protein
VLDHMPSLCCIYSEGRNCVPNSDHTLYIRRSYGLLYKPHTYLAVVAPAAWSELADNDRQPLFTHALDTNSV